MHTKAMLPRDLCEPARCKVATPPKQRAWRLCRAGKSAAAAGEVLALQCAVTGLHSGVCHWHSWLDIGG